VYTSKDLVGMAGFDITTRDCRRRREWRSMACGGRGRTIVHSRPAGEADCDPVELEAPGDEPCKRRGRRLAVGDQQDIAARIEQLPNRTDLLSYAIGRSDFEYLFI